MKRPKELKKHVLERLMCCWGECCAVFLIIAGELLALILALMLVYDYFAKFSKNDFPPWLAAALAAVFTALLWVAVAPFAYGVKWYRIQQIRGNAVFARSMFSCYASLKKTLQVLKLNSMLTLRRIPALVLIGGAISSIFYIINESGKLMGQDSFSYRASAAVTILLAATGFCLFMVLGLKYAPAPYLYALEPDSSPKEIIAKSKKIMKNNYQYLIDTMLSMAGWLVPCILVFPMLFIVPYTQMIYTAAINEIIEQDREKDDEQNEQYKHERQLTTN